MRKHSVFAAALAVGLLLAISSPVRAKNPFDLRHQSRGSAVSLQFIQLAQLSSSLRRPNHPLPAEHVETIRRFIETINESRPQDAADMLSAELVPDAAAKRDWIRHFSAIKSIHVVAIEPSAVAATEPCSEYKVKLEAYVAADPKAAMPYYGWEDNPNYRWIELCPDRTGAWVISSFGTGP